MNRFLALYAWLIAINATLVFLVQPIVGRMLLPILGGTAVVWNACLVFFQAALVLGYVYAHVLASRFPLRLQVVVHSVALASAAFLLPISFTGTSPSGDGSPVIWLLAVLVGKVGLPFMLVCAGAPLFQSWFHRTGHPAAEDPYHLYAASNLGSVVGLVAYPILLEPQFTLPEQSRAWSIGYWVLLGVVVLTGALTARAASAGGQPRIARETGEAPRMRDLIQWASIAALPSALLVAVTSHITTDIAPIPLLWVIPLVLFLLSFVVAFARRRPFEIEVWAAIAVPAAMLTCFLVTLNATHITAWVLLLHLGTFFVIATTLHMLLNDLRPAPARLTSYYIAMSIGGVIGGASVALIAPVAFSTTLEYPLLLAGFAALFWKIGGRIASHSVAKWVLLIAFVGMVLGATFVILPLSFHPLVLTGSVLVAILMGAWVWRRPREFTAAFLALVAVLGLAVSSSGIVLHRGRSYFGSFSVTIDPLAESVRLVHGKVVHGTQNWIGGEPSHEPTMYYHRKSGVGLAFQEVRRRKGEVRVAVVGLGVGTLAAYAETDVQMDFYEIDPEIERVARDPRYFRYLQECSERCNVILGDARIELAKAKDASYDLIVEDAFNSDAVPFHLLTREAMAMYLDKLADGGLLAFHVSNHYLSLIDVVAALAREFGLAITLNQSRTSTGAHSDWLILAREESDFGRFFQHSRSSLVEPPPDFRVWTDDYANLLSVYRW